MTYGPMHLVAVGFEEPEFHGKILEELRLVREKGLIRLIDLQFVWKDENGDIAALEATDLSEEEQIRFGAVVGGLIGLGAAGKEGMKAGIEAGALAVAEHDYGITDGDIMEIADAIPNNSAAGIMLFEHLWAIKLKEAFIDAGAIPIAQGIVTPESLMMVGAELAAAVEAAKLEE
ncbi:DUF1269 domain-containing protein [Methanogenium sp. MK-MG]|uniref:DUF1269 domain-containing protein n=1 Tax=Methanogenium sp. MK-MG TaxID=2599926 RepID=UPI001C2057DB|nr:DUF1269 domain-containing protein [Methanogenium sp. MK-MG]KAF1078529.1 hypothetical protein MKMG_00586 [Methanogenium sp. MK-MG]